MIDKAISELKKDLKLKEVIEKVGKVDFNWGEENHFLMLSRSVAFQQLAGKAANSIWNKVLERTEITPKAILKADLTGTGLSGKKIEYIKDIAKHFEEKTLRTDFDNLSDEEVISELTKIKGVGKWTAEMFLMFSLKRLNVFSNGDYGLRKAVQKLYGLKEMPKEKEVEKIAEKWNPYKTVAALYLWKWLD